MTSHVTPFLLTGVTGPLGGKILDDMLHVHKISAASIIATSRSESNRTKFEAQGLKFAVADYQRRETLEEAFANVENLLFMSSSERSTDKRTTEHRNVIEVAKQAGVKRVWYVSLAFGGFEDTSRIGVQAAHYITEDLLQNSGLEFISLRAGIYTDAFPLFLNWYPSSTVVLLPNMTPSVSEGRIAFTTRAELGEGIATLLARGLTAFPSIQPRTEKNILLLTAAETTSLVDLVSAIGTAQGKEVPVEYLEPEEWINASAEDDVGGKGKAWFETRLVWLQGVAGGDAAVVDPALETLLGRRSEAGVRGVERLLTEEPGYTWHQNYAR